MVFGRRHQLFLVIPLILLLLLTACERPLASNDNEAAEEATEATAVVATSEADATDEEGAQTSGDADTETAGDMEVEDADEPAEEATSSDPDVGGGTPDMAAEEEAAEGEESEQAPTDEESSTEGAEAEETDADAAAEESATEEASTGEDSAETEQAGEAEATEGDAAEESAAADTSDSESTEAETTTADEATESSVSTLPATHTVAPGENLYRIGLKYGMSWVTLARYNHLPNANYIYVGQVLQIPGGGSPSPTPPPTPPDESGYTYYVVQRGDTLNSIGRKFGVSWVEMAEANGIVNPNLIYAGQVLKIPTSQPETPPAVTHTVKPGETLYRISLQYGVHWLSIAGANNIAPPYVIYPGQVLAIPSG